MPTRPTLRGLEVDDRACLTPCRTARIHSSPTSSPNPPVLLSTLLRSGHLTCFLPMALIHFTRMLIRGYWLLLRGTGLAISGCSSLLKYDYYIVGNTAVHSILNRYCGRMTRAFDCLLLGLRRSVTWTTPTLFMSYDVNILSVTFWDIRRKATVPPPICIESLLLSATWVG